MASVEHKQRRGIKRRTGDAHSATLVRPTRARPQARALMRITQIALCGEQAHLVVEVPDLRRCTTDRVPQVPETLFSLFPGLDSHRCHNDRHCSFREECECTEVPHLFEHLVIELQLKAQYHRLLRGETQWDWTSDPEGLFKVRVDYSNEHLVLGAIRLAERLVNAACDGTVGAIDVPTEMEKLHLYAEIG